MSCSVHHIDEIYQIEVDRSYIERYIPPKSESLALMLKGILELYASHVFVITPNSMGTKTFEL